MFNLLSPITHHLTSVSGVGILLGRGISAREPITFLTLLERWCATTDKGPYSDLKPVWD
jgi:hypothetical protein